MSRPRSDSPDAVTNRLRAGYLAGKSIPELIRGEESFRSVAPADIMFKFIEAFGVGLADVSCIDGWWPPNAPGEVTDENLDRWVRRAIETQRSVWERQR